MRRAGGSGRRPILRSLGVVAVLSTVAAGCGWGGAETAAVDDTIVVGDEVVRADVLANDRVSEGDEVVSLRAPGGPAGVEVDGLVLLVGPFGSLDRTSFGYELETAAGDRASATVRVSEGETGAAPPPDDPADDRDDDRDDDEPPPVVQPPDDPPPEPEIALPDLVLELEQLGPAPDDAVEYRMVVSNVGPGVSPPVLVAVAAGQTTRVTEIPGLSSGEIFGLGGVLDTNPAPGITLIAEVDVEGGAAETDEGNNVAAAPIDYLPRGTLQGPAVIDESSGGWEYEFSVVADDPDGGDVTVVWFFSGGGFDSQEDGDDGSVRVFGGPTVCGEPLVLTAELIDDENNSAVVRQSFEAEWCRTPEGEDPEDETAPIL